MKKVSSLAFTGIVLAALAAPAGAQEDGASAPPPDRDGETGEEVFEYWCEPCHGAGPGHPGTAALEVLYDGAKPALLTERTDLVPALTRSFVRNGVSIMPFFRKTEISDEELEALAEYLAP